MSAQFNVSVPEELFREMKAVRQIMPFNVSRVFQKALRKELGLLKEQRKKLLKINSNQLIQATLGNVSYVSPLVDVSIY